MSWQKETIRRSLPDLHGQDAGGMLLQISMHVLQAANSLKRQPLWHEESSRPHVNLQPETGCCVLICSLLCIGALQCHRSCNKLTNIALVGILLEWEARAILSYLKLLVRVVASLLCHDLQGWQTSNLHKFAGTNSQEQSQHKL